MTMGMWAIPLDRVEVVWKGKVVKSVSHGDDPARAVADLRVGRE